MARAKVEVGAMATGQGHGEQSSRMEIYQFGSLHRSGCSGLKNKKQRRISSARSKATSRGLLKAPTGVYSTWTAGKRTTSPGNETGQVGTKMFDSYGEQEPKRRFLLVSKFRPSSQVWDDHQYSIPCTIRPWNGFTVCYQKQHKSCVYSIILNYTSLYALQTIKNI